MLRWKLRSGPESLRFFTMSVSKWLLTLLLSAAVAGVTYAAFERVLNMEPGRSVASAAPADAPAGAVGTASTDAAPVSTEQQAPSPTADVPAEQPVEIAVEPVAAATATAPATVRAEPAADSAVKVVISTVHKPGQRTLEYVSLVNESGRVDMTGWTIVSPSGATYTFPSFVLFSNTFVRVYTMSGADTPTTLFWNQGEAIWKVGDLVLLKNGDVEMARFTVK